MPSKFSLSLLLYIYLISLNTYIISVSAQFAFFDQLFGQGDHHAQQQQQQRGGGSASSQWSMYADSVPCNKYLCPNTLACVANPIDCPCPSVEDTRCIIPDFSGSGTVLCVRGGEDCAEVKRLSKKLV